MSSDRSLNYRLRGNVKQTVTHVQYGIEYYFTCICIHHVYVTVGAFPTHVYNTQHKAQTGHRFLHVHNSEPIDRLHARI
jgi:hypothetical protein